MIKFKIDIFNSLNLVKFRKFKVTLHLAQSEIIYSRFYASAAILSAEKKKLIFKY